jgi:uncharacterized membrane protein
MIFTKELKKVLCVVKGGEFSTFRNIILFVGCIIVLENGSINMALADGQVASVMAIKRLMPFFAFLIGYFYFKEQKDIRKKILATILLIIGSVFITIF